LDRTFSAEPLSIATHGESWLRELLNHGRSPETAKLYRYCLSYFGRWLDSAGIPVADVSRSDVEEWIESMRAGRLSPATIRQRVTIARDFYRWLVGYGLLEKDPLYLIGRIKVPRKLPEILRPPDIQRILSACADTRERVIIEMLYATACRKAELIAMRLQDLDLEGRTVRLMGKGRKERVALIHDRAVEAVRAWLPDRDKIATRFKVPTDRLLVGRMGPLKKTQVLTIVHAVASRAGINRRVFVHLFRHSAAVALMDNGARIEEVKDILGHESIATTQIYTQVSTARLRAVYDRAHPRASTESPPAP